MEENKLGIELIKKAIKTVVNTAKEIHEAKINDGEISKLELIGLGDNAIAIGSQAMKIKEIIKQAKDIDSEEAKELITYVISLGVGSEDVQKIMTHSFAYIQIQIDAYNEHLKPIIEIIKGMKK